MSEFITIKKETEAEIDEKKSRFIANIFPINSVIEAEKRIEEIRKKYKDARHHCYAYRVLQENTILEKCSDDGEPSGTAGAPIISILQKQELCGIVVIVTRYFGGILLGTGGLVRAYSEATNSAIQKTEKVKNIDGYEVKIEIPYKDLEKIQYYCRKVKIDMINVEYNEIVTITVELTQEQKEEIEKNIADFNFNIQKIETIRKKYIQKKCDK